MMERYMLRNKPYLDEIKAKEGMFQLTGLTDNVNDEHIDLFFKRVLGLCY